MKRYKGYHIFAMDGDMYDLPPSEDVLNHNYKGYPVGDDTETHFLKMYVVRCIDIFSSAVIGISYSEINDEIGQAINILKDLPKKSIILFDRLYLSKRLIEAHTENGLNFLARCKKGATFKEIIEFYASNKRRSFFILNGVLINLVKIKNPRGEDIVLAANFDISSWTNKELSNLYSLRWDCETSNRDSTSTLKLEQWHTTFFNGILQELYVHLTMMNLTKMSIFLEGGYKIDLDKNETRKSNFKFIYSLIIDMIPSLILGISEKAFLRLKELIKKTVERRKRLFRFFPREVKKRGKQYTNASLVPRRY